MSHSWSLAEQRRAFPKALIWWWYKPMVCFMGSLRLAAAWHRLCDSLAVSSFCFSFLQGEMHWYWEDLDISCPCSIWTSSVCFLSVHQTWCILMVSCLDLILSWRSDTWGLRSKEHLLHRSWASHNRLGLNERSKNENYTSVILNILVSHSLFGSNKTLLGREWGRRARNRSQHLCSLQTGRCCGTPKDALSNSSCAGRIGFRCRRELS